MIKKKIKLTTLLLPVFIASSLSYSVFISNTSANETPTAAPVSKLTPPSKQARDSDTQYDDEGYDSAGYDSDGYDREGYNRAGYDRDGFDRDGYNRAGYDRDSYDRDGYNPAGYDRDSYDREGYNAAGYDRNGVDRDGNSADETSDDSAFYQVDYLVKQPLIIQFPKDANRNLSNTNLPNPRAISNAVVAQSGDTQNHKNLSDMFWLWGQFIDHDIDLSLTDPSKSAFIDIPTDDATFSGQMSFHRSVTNSSGEQLNDITPYIDGSNIYASSNNTESSLRTGLGGKFILDNNLLPVDDLGMFISGDIRVNENIALSAMHTIWVREHNRTAKRLGNKHPEWDDDQLFNAARKIVVAEMQAITFNEFLPLLLGSKQPAAYQGYDSNVSPQILSSFSTAAYRLGHTMLPSTLLRLNKRYRPIAAGHVPLKNAFFNPQLIKDNGIDSILRGLSAQTAQAVDPLLVDDIRNFLFANVGTEGFDLASLNIQRGRDHLLPSYNAVRQAIGLAPLSQFDSAVFQAGTASKLASIYTSPEEIDLWVGGLAEQAEGDSLVGPVFTHIIKQQFENIRAGDPAWYENGQFGKKQLRKLKRLKLADIIKRNTGIKRLHRNVLIARGLPQARQPSANMQAPIAETNRSLDSNIQQARQRARSRSNTN